jgi:hypothetical protein
MYQQKKITKSQSMPFYLCDIIFYGITNAEADSQANRDYTVVQLDYFPHSPQAGMSRSELYKKGSKK